jgi:hypothetical protein
MPIAREYKYGNDAKRNSPRDKESVVKGWLQLTQLLLYWTYVICLCIQIRTVNGKLLFKLSPELLKFTNFFKNMLVVNFLLKLFVRIALTESKPKEKYCH